MITLRAAQDLEQKLSLAQQESKLLNRHLHESEEARRSQQRQVLLHLADWGLFGAS